MSLQASMDEDLRLIEGYLKQRFVDQPAMAGLYDAMNYSLLSGGKRIRPVLTLEVCAACGGDKKNAVSFACAVELIHTYSLIHDDLPCMDNDDLRRGRATNHKVFGEPTALLAGDGLLTAAFETLADAGQLRPAQIAEGVLCLSRAAGPGGMVGGQSLDIAGEGKPLSLSELEEIHTLKTGALLTAAAELGCIAAGADEHKRSAVRCYARQLGLAFQIRDDMLNVEGDTEKTGKSVGSDAASGKTTFATLYGLERCRQLVEELTQEASSALTPFSAQESACLSELAMWLAGRNH